MDDRPSIPKGINNAKKETMERNSLGQVDLLEKGPPCPCSDSINYNYTYYVGSSCICSINCIWCIWFFIKA